jgi:hypothetical protein
MGPRRRSESASQKGAQIKSLREECALSMGLRKRPKSASQKDAQIKSLREEFA